MIIRDKQDLRRCVKQAVRRAEVVETRLDFDVQRGEVGVGALMGTLTAGEAALGSGTPLDSDAVEAFAALDALDLPAHDLSKAEAIAQGYDRESYLAQVLRAAHLRRVLVSVPLAQAEQTVLADSRFAPLLNVDADAFAPGRYGVDYREVAQRIALASRACGAKDVSLETWDMQAAMYCLAPVCEDECLVLHVRLHTPEQAEQLLCVMDAHPRLRVLAYGRDPAERTLIEASARNRQLLVRLTDPRRLGEAVGLLGTRVLAYSACAKLPEQMLGRWVRVKEIVWQALYEAYLPLARAGYELTDDAVERDALRMLGGAYEELHTTVYEEDNLEGGNNHEQSDLYH